MSQQPKTHARDYLIDFSQTQDDWLKLLILEALNTNGKISGEKLDKIYSCLKDLKYYPEGVEKLRKVHDRVSGGRTHGGTESENNPIDVEEFNRLVSDLENVKEGNNQ